MGTSPSPTVARARAGPARVKRNWDTPGLRLHGLHWVWESGAGERGGRALFEPLPVIQESSEVADDIGFDALAAALQTFDCCAEDAEGERASHKFCENPFESGKENNIQLETDSGESTSGNGEPLSVDMTYSSKSCSASFAGHQQRVHAVDPEEVDHENFWYSQFSNFAIRRKEQHQGSSSHNIQEVAAVILLDDEERQPAEEVGHEAPDKHDDPRAVELSRSDIRCLEPGVYLSSPVINYYIEYIKRTKLPKEDKFYIFNTYFYSKLEQAFVRTSDFLKLRRWWKGVNVFQRSYIILPIHGMAHWSLVVICVPGKESNSGPIILHMDSLGLHSSTEIFDTIKRYLEEEWRYLKKNPPHDTYISDSVWEDLPNHIHMEIVEVPQQNNDYDCGVFMLYYITRFVREAPERFTRDKLSMFSRTWFDADDASELRVRIRELLLEEFESARLDDAISDASTSSDTSEMVVECVELEDSSDGSKVEEEDLAIVSPSRLKSHTIPSARVASKRPAAMRSKSELDRYLEDARASESAFREHRSRLASQMLEALMCSQDLIHNKLKVDELLYGSTFWSYLQDIQEGLQELKLWVKMQVTNMQGQ